MKAFLTGSTGLLGGHIVEELLKNKWEVKALARSKSKGKRIERNGVEIIQGDLKHINDFGQHLEGCDVLIHAGAYFTEFFKTGNEGNPLHEINVKGTELILREAWKRGIKNIIYVSSSGVLDTTGSKPASERSPYAEDTDNPYFKSKIEAEKKVKTFIKQHPEMRVISILPAIMMGPGDHAPTRMGEFVQNFLAGKLPVVLPIRMVVTDARDVACAIVKAISKGKNGTRYVVGGHAYEMTQIVETLSKVSGKPMPKRRPNLRVAMLMSDVIGFISRIRGQTSPLPRKDELRKLSVFKGFSYDKAKRELGICCRSLEVTIDDTVTWFENNKEVG